MKKYLIIAVTVAIFTISGCALFGEVAEKIASGVEKYCEQPLSYRQTYGNTVNSYLGATGHVVHVHCAGDPDSTPE